MQPDEEAVYTSATNCSTQEVTDATFRAAVNRLGERSVVDLVGVVGYYHLFRMLLNIDRYPLPEGAKPELNHALTRHSRNQTGQNPKLDYMKVPPRPWMSLADQPVRISCQNDANFTT